MEKYSLTDLATNKSVNQTVLVRVISIENYSSELSNVALTSSIDADGVNEEIGDIKKSYFCNKDNFIGISLKKIRFGNKILPEEYQQVEYIESTGTQWIDTKYRFYGGTAELYMKFSLSNVSPPIWTANFVSGARNKTKPLKYFFGVGVINAGSTTYLRATCGATLIDNGLIIDDTHEIKEINDINLVLNENDKILTLINKGQRTSMVYSNSAINSSNFILFGASEYLSDSSIYRAEIRDNEELERNFIPCYSTTKVIDINGKECLAGTIGLYDTVEGKFYTNQGAGTFKKGSDV